MEWLCECVQVVDYDVGTAPDRYPALLIAQDETIERVSLETGTQLTYTLDERRCAGTIDGDRHSSCGSPQTPWCDRHRDQWPCARCSGSCGLPLESCREEHAVYLAAFAPATFKVGVTRRWRLEERLREQGADRAAHLHTVENGRIARRIEHELANSIGDSVRVTEKITGLAQPINDKEWRNRLSEFDPITTMSFAYDLELLTRPVVATVASGTVRGTKGRILVLERAGGTYAVDMRDLVGYEVQPHRSTRELQSKLGSFG